MKKINKKKLSIVWNPKAKSPHGRKWLPKKGWGNTQTKKQRRYQESRFQGTKWGKPGSKNPAISHPKPGFTKSGKKSHKSKGIRHYIRTDYLYGEKTYIQLIRARLQTLEARVACKRHITIKTCWKET